MPFYEYQCSNCGHELEELQKMSDEPLLTCPNCGKDTLKRLIGTGAGLIFKGSGFYLTDYKNSGKDASKSDSSKSSSTTKDSKPETKANDSSAASTKSSGTKQPESKITKTKKS